MALLILQDRLSHRHGISETGLGGAPVLPRHFEFARVSELISMLHNHFHVCFSLRGPRRIGEHAVHLVLLNIPSI